MRLNYPSSCSTIRLFAAIAVLFLVGCASPSVSENQCRAGDWESVGFRDGTSGLASTRILAHQEACGEFGIYPDRVTYLAGWDDGNSQFCTADNGFKMGKRGARNSGVCPSRDFPGFADAYADGREIYEAGRTVRSLENQLTAAENRLQSIKQEIVGATTAQLQTGLSAEERLRLVVVLESLIEERGEVKESIPVLEDELFRSKAHFDQVNARYTVASRY